MIACINCLNKLFSIDQFPGVGSSAKQSMQCKLKRNALPKYEGVVEGVPPFLERMIP